MNSNLHHLHETRAVSRHTERLSFFYTLLALLFIGWMIGCGAPPRGTITGNVILENQTNHEGVQIYLPGTQYRAVTDQSGSFILQDIPPGTYTLVAVSDGFVEHRQEFELQGNQTRSLGVVVLSKEIPLVGNLSGFATLQGKTTHEGIILLLVGSPYSTTTSTTGYFQFERIPTGTYTLLAFKEGWLPASVDSIDIRLGEETKLEDIELRAPSTNEEIPQDATPVILGNMRYRGSAFLQGSLKHNGIRVSLQDRPQKYAITSTTGSFELTHIDESPHSLVFSYEGYQSETIPNAIPQPATSTRTVGFVTLRKKIDAEGVGFLQGYIELEDQESHANTVVRILGISQSVVTDDNGRFLFVAIPAGSYTVTAEHPGYNSIEIKSVLIIPDRISQTPKRTLTRSDNSDQGTGAIHGSAFLDGKTDHGGILVAVEGTDKNTVTGPSGEFILEDVPAGAYRLIFTKEGYKNFYWEGAVVNPDEQLELEPVVLVPDIEPPFVVETLPRHRGRDVPIDRYVDVLIRFSERMDGDSVKRSVIVEPPVDFNAFFDRESELSNIDILHLRLYQNGPNPVQFETNYNVIITPEARTPKGVPLAEPFQFSFVTGGPLILRSIPGEGNSDVQLGIGDPIWVETNAPVDLRTLQRALRFRPKPDTEPFIQVKENAVGNEILIYTQLRADTRYRMMIDNQVRTTFGKRFENTPLSITFHTIDNQSTTPVEFPIRERSNRRRR